MWSCATTDTWHAQRSYLTVVRLSVAYWKSVLIIQKNTLYKNKIRATYFCPTYVSFLPANVHFFIFWEATAPNSPPPVRL